MISHDHITIDGDTAWLVLPPFDPEVELPEDDPATLDRPCDACFGHQYVTKMSDETKDNRCPDCTNGRHVFEIEVAHPDLMKAALVSSDAVVQRLYESPRTLSVYVVEVLPIVEATDVSDPNYPVPEWGTPDAIFYDPKGREWFRWTGTHGYVDAISYRCERMPESAAPGKWAVRLKVAT